MLKSKMEEFSKKKGLKVVGKSQEELKKFISVEKG
jgi:hypothetical protein